MQFPCEDLLLLLLLLHFARVFFLFLLVLFYIPLDTHCAQYCVCRIYL